VTRAPDSATCSSNCAIASGRPWWSSPMIRTWPQEPTGRSSCATAGCTRCA